MDLSPVIQRVDAIGGLVDGLSKTVGGLGAADAELAKKLGEVERNQTLILTALHHIYLNLPTAANTQGQANDLPSFKAFLARYAGLPQ